MTDIQNARGTGTKDSLVVVGQSSTRDQKGSDRAINTINSKGTDGGGGEGLVEFLIQSGIAFVRSRFRGDDRSLARRWWERAVQMHPKRCGTEAEPKARPNEAGVLGTRRVLDR